MNTNLLYLENTYLFRENATIINIGTDERSAFIVLDRSIFYPQGGGQESDKGEIRLTTGESAIIDFVKFEQGVVFHYTESNLQGFHIGANVALLLDKQHRIKCAALHTAGHLVCGLAVRLIPELKPVKGYHFRNGSYIELLGEIDDTNTFLEKLGTELEEIKQANCEITSEIVSYESLLQRCSYIPEGLPIGKPLRIVTIGSLDPLPCGGTHLNNTSEIKNIVTRKIKKGKGLIKISYDIVL
jgi:Ser-tRNA(Ala) deacylase AlaX